MQQNKTIQIKKARVHNLKAVDIEIPKNELVVITGVSGSGKSSLAFDTLYAEGRRRYVESLSSYARQFLGKMEKPDVEDILGITPAVAIEQKVVSRNSRSTVGTSTEIFDYLKILFARIGKTISPISGKAVKRDTITDVVNFILHCPEKSKFALYSPVLLPEDRTWEKHLELLQSQGFNRIKLNGDLLFIEEALSRKSKTFKDIQLLIDRVANTDTEENRSRLGDSVETAFQEGHGNLILELVQKEAENTYKTFSNKFEMDGIVFEQPHPSFFSFNSPLGACKTCEGFGQVVGIDPDLVIPNKEISVFDKAIACWRGEKMSEWLAPLLQNAMDWDFPIHRPICDLSEDQIQLLWEGKKPFKGLNKFFEFLSKQGHKIQYRVMESRFRGKTKCPECNGSRIRKDALYVQINKQHIGELSKMQVGDLQVFFKGLDLNKTDAKIADRLLFEITTRLHFLTQVGLHYLTLDRKSNTLSGGESQRIHLSTSLGSSLVGSTYILDEPSIGLHPKDTEQLIGVMKSLRDQGNTVVVVEHDEEVMRASDFIIDMGPEAGTNGGYVVFAGKHSELSSATNSLTAEYLTGQKVIPTPEVRRKYRNYVELTQVAENNLKKFDIQIPLQCFVAVTGVSGSGKSTLIRSILVPALNRHFDLSFEKAGAFGELKGSFDILEDVEMIDQNPIGKSSRSNPVTYLKAYDEIRKLMSEQPLAKSRRYKSSAFSFNINGGRCDECEGEGQVKIEMQFMADIEIPCEECEGKRFKGEILEVEFDDKNIHDVLSMTVEDAIAFFTSNQDEHPSCKKIIKKMKPLHDVGLGYVKLGQSSSTLSGGEAQRVKLASFLAKGSSAKNTLFVFDEPTTGLHAHDNMKLINALNALIDRGNSVIVIEHNLDVIKSADWIIELGPEGGTDGGHLHFQGTPEELAKNTTSHTAPYLKKVL
ncbi:MAG: excinuclease ABC subunit A [Luteibaculaceae bacterium]|jgi:excinuclease ABC subunit A